MIIHPSLDRERLRTCGGRLLIETFGLIGEKVTDPLHPEREWTIDGFYEPIRGRAVGGIRARLIDQKGFISFINQRDLEILLGLMRPGEYCQWLGKDYVDPYDRHWLGFCMDSEDLQDDLFARETELRYHQEEATGGRTLPEGYELERLIHTGGSTDLRELLFLRLDYDIETGQYPDERIRTVDMRWMRIEKQLIVWRQV